ncbi:beta-N-acetylhexosaminidase [bacterium]|nr:MAG: beta-N-acetylhexosaminidase [bacterium]
MSAAALTLALSLSLEQQVGQLFVVTVDTVSAARDEDLIRGGLVSGGLLRWDKFTAAELAAFTAWLRERSPKGLPYMVFADHEGGPLFTQRSFGATVMPGNMALGAADDESLAAAAAEASARELAALGVHADFAPAVDVNSNPLNPIIGVRSYGSAPDRVAALGAAQVRGYLAGGVMPVAKHFPGHGDTATDSHVGLPVVDRPRASFDRVELPPFKAAIAAGVPMVMPAHVVAPALGAADRPVTFSAPVLEGVLRGELGFSGVVVSDSLDMGAVAKSTDVAEASVLSFLAGCDFLLTGKTDYRRTYGYFLEAVRSGRVPQERLAAAVGRILALKARFPAAPPALDAAYGPATAKAVAEAGLTLVRGSLPLKAKAGPLVLVAFRSKSYAKELESFAAGLARRFPGAEAVFLDPKPSPEDAAKARAAAAKAGALAVGTYLWGATPPKEQVDLAAELFALGKPSVQLSLMNPYDADRYPAAGAVLALYGPTPAMLEAAAAALAGELEPSGALPVALAKP